MTRPVRVGIIGWGAIAREVVAALAARPSLAVEHVGVLRRSTAGAPPPVAVDSVAALLEARPDVVIEAAGQEAVRELVTVVLRAGVPAICTSVGALADERTVLELDKACRAGATRVVVPSGAVGALDLLRAAAVGGLERVTVEQRKPPSVLLDRADAAAVAAARTLFRGTAREAARRYPKTMNIVAAVALAGVGLDRTEAALIADPTVTAAHVHVTAEGGFGRLTLDIEHHSSENPATSIVTPWSVVAAIENEFASTLVYR